MNKEYHQLTDEDLARIIHEAHLALRIGLNDSATDVHFDALPPERQAMETLQARMFRDGADEAEVHRMWVDWMQDQGFRYGASRDLVRKTHPSMMDYEDLPPDGQAKVRQARNIVLTHLAAMMTHEEALS